MKKYNSKLIITGLLFLVATISYLIGSSILEKSFDSLINNEKINSVFVSIGILLELLNIFAVVSIGCLLLSILKSFDSKIPTLYLISRIVEGAFLCLSILSIVQIFFNEKSRANPADSIYLYNSLFQIGMIALGIGSILLMVLFHKKNIAPKGIYSLGMIAYSLLIFSGVAEITGISANFTLVLYLPGTVFELWFPFWLIKKGLSNDMIHSTKRTLN